MLDLPADDYSPNSVLELDAVRRLITSIIPDVDRLELFRMLGLEPPRVKEPHEYPLCGKGKHHMSPENLRANTRGGSRCRKCDSERAKNGKRSRR